MSEPTHSISKESHPLAAEDDFEQIRDDVQFCRITWPLLVQIEPADLPPSEPSP